MAYQNLPNPGRFIGDALVNLYQDRIKQLISDLGRNVVFVLPPQHIDCPNCGFDIISGRSNGLYTSNASGVAFNKSFAPGQTCPVCQGRGKLEFRRTATHKCLIGFAPPPEEFDYKIYGVEPTQVIRTKNAISVFDDVNVAKTANIDGIECEKITMTRKSGLRDLAFITTYWKRLNS